MDQHGGVTPNPFNKKPKSLIIIQKTKGMAKNNNTTEKKKPKKPGRKPSKKKLLEVIDECCGVVTDIAKTCNVTRKAVHGWIKKDPSLKTAIEDARDNLVDLAKSGLKQNIIEGKEKSIIYVLGTLGRKEGFGNFIQVQDRSKLEEQLDDMTDEEILAEMANSNRRMNKAIKGEK